MCCQIHMIRSSFLLLRGRGGRGGGCEKAVEQKDGCGLYLQAGVEKQLDVN